MAESIDSRAARATGDERRHTEHGLERKRQLLDAAAALFAERGYAATRIADICAASGVAKGLFYWYFPTKQELFAELVRTMRGRLRRAQAAAMDPAATTLERIGQGVAASVRFMAEQAAYFALLDVERADPDMAALLAEGPGVFLADLRPLIAEAQHAGAVRAGDPDLLAVGVLGAVSSFSNAFRSGRLGDVAVDELAAFVSGWVTAALAPS